MPCPLSSIKEENMTDWGLVLKEVRKKKNWTISHLARESEVSRRTIYTLEECGGGKIETYEKLFQVMGYDLEVLRADEWALCGLR